MHPARTEAPAAPAPGLKGTLQAYVGLTKPRIIELLLVTTFPAMFLAARRVPPAGAWPR
jgi:protoheme IX farnesyltransferase